MNTLWSAASKSPKYLRIGVVLTALTVVPLLFLPKALPASATTAPAKATAAPAMLLKTYSSTATVPTAVKAMPPISRGAAAAPASTTTQPPAPSTSPKNVTVQAASPWSATVTWNAPAGAANVRVYRDGRLLDEAAASAGSALTDRLLWPHKSFTFRVVAVDSSGASVLDESATVTTPSQTSSVGRLYADSSLWNTPIPSGAAIDPASAAMVSKSFSAYRSSANFANSAAWGAPLAYATELSKNYSIGCTLYDCNTQISFRVPSYATPATGSDAHLAVVDPSSNRELDMWQAKASWSASSRFATTSNGSGSMCAVGQHCNGANAAGFSLLGGVVRPEEVAQGHIDHALALTTPVVRSGMFACPASHTDGNSTDPNAVPEGARVQLDPSINVDAQPWSTWQKTVAKALQRYGAYVADRGGSVAVRGESETSRGYDGWSLAGVTGSSLNTLPWDKLNVLKVTKC
jgi:hypothetical protein